MLAPCLTKWPTNSGKVLLTPSFTRLNEADWVLKNNHRLVATQMQSTDHRTDFPMNNEQIIRRAYELAEKVDVKGWVECFTSDGTFTDMSIGVTYRGPDGPTGLGKTVEVYAKAFPDMHRELYRFFSVGDVVVVELALQGTHKGPLPTPMGIIPPTGKRMDAPCCDVFRLVNGKIQSFDCYPSGTVTFAQLGVLSNIEAAIARS
jgi:ketosteroid isomerase-like protein